MVKGNSNFQYISRHRDVWYSLGPLYVNSSPIWISGNAVDIPPYMVADEIMRYQLDLIKTTMPGAKIDRSGRIVRRGRHHNSRGGQIHSIQVGNTLTRDTIIKQLTDIYNSSGATPYDR